MTKLKNKMKMKLKNIKLEDIMCNIYNFLLKISSCNYQFCFHLKKKMIWEKEIDDIKQSQLIAFLAQLIQTPRQYDCDAFNDCLLHFQFATT